MNRQQFAPFEASWLVIARIGPSGPPIRFDDRENARDLIAALE
jgi:hypothetical protein